MALTSDLCEALLGRGPADRLSYREAFQKYVGLDPLTAETGELTAAVRRLGIAAPETLASDDRDGWLDLLLTQRVQPHLGIDRPALVYDYPASQAALARIRLGNPPVAERFELYVLGIELANGYHELTDAAELRRRNAAVNAQRVADGKPALPAESRLLAAMDAGLPPAVGVALGFDRLVMLAAGADSVAEVIAFPFDRA
jgi:lysyl-tRNA synthetase class 2